MLESVVLKQVLGGATFLGANLALYWAWDLIRDEYKASFERYFTGGLVVLIAISLFYLSIFLLELKLQFNLGFIY